MTRTQVPDHLQFGFENSITTLRSRLVHSYVHDE